MKNKNKEVLGKFLMYLVAGVSAIGLYYLGKTTLDPFLIASLLFISASLVQAIYKWIRINFQVPDDFPDPDFPSSTETGDWVQVNTGDSSYWVKNAKPEGTDNANQT